MYIKVSPGLKLPVNESVIACVPDITFGLTKASSALNTLAYIASNISRPISP